MHTELALQRVVRCNRSRRGNLTFSWVAGEVELRSYTAVRSQKRQQIVYADSTVSAEVGAAQVLQSSLISEQAAKVRSGVP